MATVAKGLSRELMVWRRTPQRLEEIVLGSEYVLQPLGVAHMTYLLST
jgi:hypothetical protein